MLPLFQVLIFGLAMEVLREVKVSSLAIAFASIRIASKVPQVLTSHSYGGFIKGILRGARCTKS